ncbi:MAG: Stk1 family PASTA domain-containing Ser/Thr kinase [Nocardioides sp.]
MDTGQQPRSGATVRQTLTGQVLGQRYRIGPRIARGGMASVFEATDLRLNREVAVKVMHPGLGGGSTAPAPPAGTSFADRFVAEARASAQLAHDNIVGIYDQGEDSDVVYLVMEYVPGRTLRDVIRAEAPVSGQRALALLEPILAALATAHRAGIIHRDVKPENVLIADDGRIKVADFGLAKAVGEETQHTATGGVLIGTVSYLAPELVVDGRADARADVYAAGVILFELLTGRKPHEGESPIQIAYKHVHEDVPPPSLLAPTIPPYLDALVARATARDRNLRPADAAVLLHQVRRVRSALLEGVGEDPELTADLTPLISSVHGTEPLSTGSLRTGPPAPDDEPTLPVQRAASSSVDEPTPPRRAWWVLVTALLLVGSLAGGIWWFGIGRYTATPDLLGLTRAGAQQALQQAGLGLDQAPAAYSETVPAGTVLRTDPEPGSRVLEGGNVRVVLSLGKERYDVPKLRGKTPDEAADALDAINLEAGATSDAYDQRIPAGEIISSNPAAGTSVKRGDQIDLVISRGKRPVPVKDWTGKDADRATSWLTDQGLVSDSASEFSASVPAGRVISQQPATGSVYVGDTVTLVISKGPPLVEIPRGIRASGVAQAVAQLEALGLTVVTRESKNYLGLGYVLAVQPRTGSQVPVGSTVTLYLV